MSMYGKYKGKVGPLDVKDWPTTDCSNDVRLTSQAPLKEVDINQIMKKIEKGQMVNVNALEGRFEDISMFDGLADAYIKVQEADKLFNSLPADIKSRFKNNPVELMDFLDDESNRKEAEDLGLIIPKVEPEQPATIPPATGGETPK